MSQSVKEVEQDKVSGNLNGMVVEILYLCARGGGGTYHTCISVQLIAPYKTFNVKALMNIWQNSCAHEVFGKC